MWSFPGVSRLWASRRESLEAWDWDDNSWTDGDWRWWEREDDDYDIDQRDLPAGGDTETPHDDPPGDPPKDRADHADATSPGPGPRGATGSSPSSRGGDTTTPAQKATSTTGLAGEALDELSLADSFILGGSPSATLYFRLPASRPRRRGTSFQARRTPWITRP